MRSLSNTFVLTRDDCQPAHTLGVLECPDGYTVQTLEDTVREPEVKVPGETAIPSGVYRLSITRSQRFQKMLPVVHDVPNFSGIRLHAGNSTADTAGCPLLGMARGTRATGEAWLHDSRSALTEVQHRLAVVLTEQGEAWLEVITPRVETSETFAVADATGVP